MNDEAFFSKAIELHVRSRVKEIAKEETDKANAEVARRISDEIDRIALNLCHEYRVDRHGDVLRIIVKKSIGGTE